MKAGRCIISVGIGLLLSLCIVVQAAEFSLVQWRGVQALRMRGAIDANTASMFNKFADQAEPAAHGLPILLLDSPGGDVFGALMLSAAMDVRPFHTVIPDGAECASACASIVFIAGRYRTMEAHGRFGQHSCARDGEPIPECNELIAQHALRHGVSHGSVSAFVTHTPPESMLWFSREDVDGWGISLYPGSEAAGFQKSEPRVIKMLTGSFPEAQDAWRLDFWEDGWRAFYRPSSDAERELQLSQFCLETVPGKLVLAMEIHGRAQVIENTLLSIDLRTDQFSMHYEKAAIWQLDPMVSMVAITIPKERVKTWLLSVRDFEYRINTAQPYQPILARGNLEGSRENLLFAANHCAVSIQ